MQPPEDLPRDVLVSVGIPVYNGEATLAAALDSVVGQSHRNLEIIISDNGSTDRTGEICGEYARRDPRIRYVRQASNIGAVANFAFVLDQATGPFFMWAAADDRRSNDFVEVNAAFLASHPEYVAATSPVRFEDGVPDGERMGDLSLDQELPEARTLRFFTRWHGNGRFYSLYRREALRQVLAFRQRPFLAADWAFMLELAQLGKLHRSSQGEVVLGVKGESSNPAMFRKVRSRPVEYLLPFWELGRRVHALSRGFSFLGRTRLFLILASLNLRCNLERARRRLVSRGTP